MLLEFNSSVSAKLPCMSFSAEMKVVLLSGDGEALIAFCRKKW